MSTRITRETFISSDHVKVAISSSNMIKLGADGESIEEVPVPDSAKETGVLPEGYAVDFLLDPSTVVSALAQENITTEEQLTPALLEKLKGKLNAPENLKIVPTSLYEQKRVLTEDALED